MERLQIAVASGGAAVGSELVSEAMRQDQLAFLLIANDASENTVKKYKLNAQRKGIPHQDTRYSGQVLGSVTKRDFVAVLGILERGLAQALIRDLHHLTRLEEIGT
jgi:ribosomal protein L7Ae-like RNA K-turn-binding protein